jgi:hypothetical protein
MYAQSLFSNFNRISSFISRFTWRCSSSRASGDSIQYISKDLFLSWYSSRMSCTGCTGTNPTVTCPSRMADGRAFTDYSPRCNANARLNELVSKAKMMQSSYESRMFLQHNAEKMMEMERARAIETLVPCAPCKRSTSDPGTMAPERYVVRCDAVSCQRTEVNPNGIGDGRNYSFRQ